MTTVIFDIDGTLSDAEHRQHFLRQEPKDWDGFYGAMKEDKPIGPIVALADALWQDRWNVIFLTGRPERYRAETIEWLAKHLAIPSIYRISLYMRKDGDRREDCVVKREAYEVIRSRGHNVELVVEDRTQCVKMWRELGLVCLQCAEGNF